LRRFSAASQWVEIVFNMSPPDPHEENILATENALRWVHGAQAEAALIAQVSRTVRARRRRRLAALSGAAAMVVGLWFFAGVQPKTESLGAPTAIVTEPRRQVLADGSIVVLRDGAEISADFSGTARRIVLRRGQAHFDVVKDPARPFVVVAPAVEVRAVGTAFSVGLGGGGVEVLVTHGRVAIEPLATAAAFVDAGHRARVPAAGGETEVSELSPAELAQASAWRTPHIEFSRTPLAEALTLINARLAHAGQRRIEADPTDEGLRELRLSGFLAADNADGFLQLLESNFGVRAERHGTGPMLLRSSR
jgi:transmembrane sensor